MTCSDYYIQIKTRLKQIEYRNESTLNFKMEQRMISKESSNFQSKNQFHKQGATIFNGMTTTVDTVTMYVNV